MVKLGDIVRWKAKQQAKKEAVSQLGRLKQQHGVHSSVHYTRGHLLKLGEALCKRMRGHAPRHREVFAEELADYAARLSRARTSGLLDIRRALAVAEIHHLQLGSDLREVVDELFEQQRRTSADAPAAALLDPLYLGSATGGVGRLLVAACAKRIGEAQLEPLLSDWVVRHALPVLLAHQGHPQPHLCTLPEHDRDAARGALDELRDRWPDDRQLDWLRMGAWDFVAGPPLSGFELIGAVNRIISQRQGRGFVIELLSRVLQCVAHDGSELLARAHEPGGELVLLRAGSRSSLHQGSASRLLSKVSAGPIQEALKLEPERPCDALDYVNDNDRTWICHSRCGRLQVHFSVTRFMGETDIHAGVTDTASGASCVLPDELSTTQVAIAHDGHCVWAQDRKRMSEPTVWRRYVPSEPPSGPVPSPTREQSYRVSDLFRGPDPDIIGASTSSPR